ncbi:CYTH and CHAD domain-containing protein [Enterovirga aerilata]|uniref:CHAD domain-containing protein n=1 Tax=Enterovirga aerilata TaxID=2730920 RepID=A0A849IBZ3_9HYPH|nr:CYTH and CHAD domain-containing protein [Enterovirga sp. DB1703]NNM73497.1 CHAD domain-containing protein [Enterovirga sp. DB1703]
MSDPRELELKLEVGPRGLARLKSRGLKQLGEASARERLASVYFDTADRRLREKGLSLRVRSVGGRHLQTVKGIADGPGIGLFERSEWESEVAGPRPDLAAAARTPVQEALAEKGAGGLRPVFAAEVERTIWLVESEGSTIEVALDEGTIAAEGASRQVAELELELKRGSAADLFALARRLDEAGALRLGVLTKSEQGYRLAEGEAQGFHKAEAVKLKRGTPTAAAFAAIVRACLRHFRLNESGVVEARLPEALHQARVAMRRLRSALSLFKELLGDPESDEIRKRLRTLSGHLGHARNLDVYLARTGTDAAEGRPADPAWIARLRAEREEAYDRIAKVLASKRFRRLMLDLLAWVEDGAWRRPADPDARARLKRPIEVSAAAILDKRRRRVRRRGRDLAELDPEMRHEVRIEAKKLRYAAEFFSGLVEHKAGRKGLKRFLSALEELQEALGDLNDLETARTLHADAEARAEEGGAPSPDDEAGREAELLERAVAAHRAFSDAKPFWRDFA